MGEIPFSISGRVVILCKHDYEKRLLSRDGLKNQKYCHGCQRRVISDKISIDKMNLTTETWHANCFYIYNVI